MNREDWYVTHICDGENYVARGPHDQGRPTHCIHCACEVCARIVSKVLNEIEEALYGKD